MQSGSLTIQFLIVAVIAGAIAGAGTSMILNQPMTDEDRIHEFYLTESLVHVSPHGLRKHMGEETNTILVDLRSEEEYLEEHVTTAVNIPAYKDRDHSDYGAVDRIVASFKELRDANPNKDIIVYCYSIPCMTGRKVGKMLADNGIYVQHLGVGWNEWRYFWGLWNHPHELETTNVEDYISSGPEPGTLAAGIVGTGCPIEGELGC